MWTLKNKLVVCNWKSEPQSAAEARRIAEEIVSSAGTDDRVVIAPSLAHLSAVREIIGDAPVLLGAQDVMPDLGSVATGEVSARMLKDAGVSHVIIGHSERRRFFHEDDALINEKMRAALAEGLTPILCIGEEERLDPGLAAQACIDQLALDIEGIVSRQFIVAYEPVWAIGGNKQIEPEQAAQTIDGIKKYLATTESESPVPVLYGGSVRCDNILSLVYFDQIDGFLVGSASLHGDAISCIINKTRNPDRETR